MHFVSFTFLLFFTIVFALYLRLSHRGQNRLLLVASYIFYGWWDWRFLGLIVLSAVVDFGCGLAADGSVAAPRSPRLRRVAVIISVVVNLGILGLFKYFGFFVESLGALLGDGLQLPFGLASLDVILPVGISFYTFQTMSYTIDVYRGRLAATRRLEDLLLYVAFFPQLVAGPIERGRHLLPQVERRRSVTRAAISAGAQLALFGYFKKMVIADNLGLYVGSVYDNPDAPISAWTVTLATYAFAFQIYADFSGYTDIARGIARMLGFDLMQNFRTPYFATNPSDFWQRWHISLSTWLRDYLYIPLGGSHHGRARTYLSLTVTMLLGGLWHGAAGHFVLWGAYHGLLLVLFHALLSRTAAKGAGLGVRSGIGYWLKVAGYFQLTCVGWLLFRADGVDQILRFGQALTGLGPMPPLFASSLLLVAVFTLPLVAFDLVRYRLDQEEPWRRWSVPAQVVFQLSLLYAIILFGTPDAADFLYFQF